MRNIDNTVQYLHWVLLTALLDANPDCVEITIKINLVRRTTTTSYVRRKQQDNQQEKETEQL